MTAPERVLVNEVGPRDGLQSLARVIPVEQRLALIEGLVAAGIASIEAGSFVSPKAVPQMAGSDRLFALLPHKDAIRYSALVPNLRGYELARAAGAGVVSVVLSATETMNRRNINSGLDETTAVCADLMQRAAADGVEGQAYVAVAFECPFEGPTPPATVERLVERMIGAGARKVIVADTIGAADPARVRDLMTRLAGRHGAGVFACHFHDTRGMALANVLAALECGVREFDSAIGGLGGCPFSPGASGNVATEDVVLMLQSMGFRTGIDLAALTDAVRQAGAIVDAALGGHAFRWLDRTHRRHAEVRHD
ncbi:hydroxymethylglutaryl-CoA lyase [Dokdonella koreensis]|uniref:Hydroxymethylglutaryl-CoA lyase n=1 Tax=Dokdonella koreensis DS-123 TaxID=1300342 RepID=A0A160DWG1_9GAMM|nr:hydroxymethylglutaryl-CoA lyase [Dokdonella koreensis]ANB18223.1 Hydroxymethylglutaryl-CoA lyase [Dokdonella koreensis DS-123]